MYIQVILNLNQEEKQLGNKFIVILKNLNSVTFKSSDVSKTYVDMGNGQKFELFLSFKWQKIVKIRIWGEGFFTL